MNKCKTDWFSLMMLMMAAIVFVTAELLPVGILPEISMSLHKPIGSVGLMVTGYAWAVVFSAVLITNWLAPVERRRLLLVITTVFAFSNLLVALSPSLTFLFFARIVGAFSHGVFWSTVASLSVRLSGPSSRARATAFVFGGIAIATVIAVPAGTLLGQWLGWRAAFVLIAFLSLMVAVGFAWHFPELPSESTSCLGQLRGLVRHPLLKRLYPSTAFALTGHFCAFTYISLLLEKSIGIPNAHLAFYLFLFGFAGVIGNVLAGKLKDHQLHRASQLTMLIMAAAIIICSELPTGSDFIAALLVIVWGAGICILTVVLQSLVLTLPKEMADAASSMHVSMFNTGIGSGALLGGILADHLSPGAIAITGAALLCVAAVMMKKNHAQYIINLNWEEV